MTNVQTRPEGSKVPKTPIVELRSISEEAIASMVADVDQAEEVIGQTDGDRRLQAALVAADHEIRDLLDEDHRRVLSAMDDADTDRLIAWCDYRLVLGMWLGARVQYRADVAAMLAEAGRLDELDGWAPPEDSTAVVAVARHHLMVNRAADKIAAGFEARRAEVSGDTAGGQA